MKKIKHYAKELLFILITVTVVANVMSIYRSRDLTHAPLQIDSLTLIDGSTYHVKEDKPLLIHFWATWCPTCKLEASNIDFLSKHFEVVTVAVKSGSDAEVRKFMQEHNYHFNVFNDSNAVLASEFHIAGFPTTFIYNKEHTLSFSEVGYSSTLTLYLKMLWAGR